MLANRAAEFCPSSVIPSKQLSVVWQIEEILCSCGLVNFLSDFASIRVRIIFFFSSDIIIFLLKKKIKGSM